MNMEKTAIKPKKREFDSSMVIGILGFFVVITLLFGPALTQYLRDVTQKKEYSVEFEKITHESFEHSAWEKRDIISDNQYIITQKTKNGNTYRVTQSSKGYGILSIKKKVGKTYKTVFEQLSVQEKEYIEAFKNITHETFSESAWKKREHISDDEYVITQKTTSGNTYRIIQNADGYGVLTVKKKIGNTYETVFDRK